MHKLYITLLLITLEKLLRYSRTRTASSGVLGCKPLSVAITPKSTSKFSMDGPDSTRSYFKNVMIAESTDNNFTCKCNDIGTYLHFFNIFLINLLIS